MRANSIIVLGGVGILLLVIQEGMGSLMLGSLLMALKGGMFAGKMGLGGMLAMFLATSQNLHTQPGYSAAYTARAQEGSSGTVNGIAGLTKKKRTARSIESVFEAKLDLTPDTNDTKTGTATKGNTEAIVSSSSQATNGTDADDHLSAEKLAASLNNISSPTSQRVMRQVAILDQLSCLPKVLCGLNTKEPSQKTSVINDYGYLIKYLFERDDDADDAEQDDDDDDKDADDDDDDAISRAESILKKSSASNPVIKSGPNTDKLKKKKKPSHDDDDYDDVEDSDELRVDDTEFDDIPDGDETPEDRFEEMAQDALLDNEPEMLQYALAEMKQKMNKHRSKYHKDHSDLAGYDKGSYHNPPQNPLLNTHSAQQILRTTPSKGHGGHKKGVTSTIVGGASKLVGNGVQFGNKNFQFKIGGKEPVADESSSIFGAILPSFLYEKIRADPSPSNQYKKKSDTSDPFANDPFFDGFRRNLKFPPEQDSPAASAAKSSEQQRANSKFKRMEPEAEAKFMERKTRQLARATNPLTKYRVAKQVGEVTRNSRQCRMLFAKCPYEYNEIMAMINNVKKLLNEQATVGDKEVLLKQPGTASGSLGSIAEALGSTSSIMTGSGGNLVNLHTGQSGSNGGVTHISQQLANGDNVEIMLKIKPKGGAAHRFPSSNAELAAANKSLQEMKKAIQAIAKLHNQTEFNIINGNTQQFQFIQPSEILAAAKVVSKASTNPTATTATTTTSTGKPFPVLKFEENKEQSEPTGTPATLTDIPPGFSGESASSSQEGSSEEVVPGVIKRKNGISTTKTKANQQQKQKPGQTGPFASASKEEDEDDEEEDEEDDEETVHDAPPSGHGSGSSGDEEGGPPPFLTDPNFPDGSSNDDHHGPDHMHLYRHQPMRRNNGPRPPPRNGPHNSGPFYIDYKPSSSPSPPHPSTSREYETIAGTKMRPPAPLPTRPGPYRIIRNKNNNKGDGR